MNTIDTSTPAHTPLPPPPISQAELQEILNYNQHTGVFTWRKTHASRARKGQVAGTKNGAGYTVIRLGKLGQVPAHKLAWLYVHGEWPPAVLRNNSDRSDNRIKNLEPAYTWGDSRRHDLFT